jgi:hypothetical protein
MQPMKKIILLLISASFLFSLNFVVAQESSNGIGTMVTIECYRNNIEFFSSSSTNILPLVNFVNVGIISQSSTSTTSTTTSVTTTSPAASSNVNTASSGGNVPLPPSILTSISETTTSQTTTSISTKSTTTSTSSTSQSHPTGFFALSNSSIIFALIAIVIVAFGALIGFNKNMKKQFKKMLRSK